MASFLVELEVWKTLTPPGCSAHLEQGRSDPEDDEVRDRRGDDESLRRPALKEERAGLQIS